MQSAIWHTFDAPYLDIYLHVHRPEDSETGATWRIQWVYDEDDGTFKTGDWEYSPNENTVFDLVDYEPPPEVQAEHERRTPDIHATFVKWRLSTEGTPA